MTRAEEAAEEAGEEAVQEAVEEAGGQAEGERAAVLERLMGTGRENSASTVMFHSAIAARQGLSATETKTLDLLVQHGPLTAKDLAGHTGLAPASVTGLVDRLESKGYVRRAKHATDKRRVVIELDQEKLSGLAAFFDDWAKEIVALCEPFSVDELETVIRFLSATTELQRRTAARLAD